MAVNKVAAHPAKKHGGLKNLLEYVLRDEKVRDGYVDITGPYDGEKINRDTVYRNWVREKQLWHKDSGRMYLHHIISFAKYETISPLQVLRIGLDLADRFFSLYQTLVCVHQDKEHLHCHIVVNSVSYVDGHKIHQKKSDLQEQKDYTNELCRQQGLSVAEKGRHFDGSAIEPETIRSWDKNKYKLLVNDEKKSYLVDLALAVNDAKMKSYRKEDFIAAMKDAGWDVTWSERRKYITFINIETGKRVRDLNLSKTFSMHISKEALEHDFSRKTEKRQQLQSTANSRGFAAEAGRGIGSDQKTGIRHQRL